MLRQNLKKKKKKKTSLKSLPRNQILGYPTWFSRPNWTVKTVLPLPLNDQIVVLQALIGLGETKYQPNNVGPGLEVIPYVGKGMALIHISNVMPCDS